MRTLHFSWIFLIPLLIKFLGIHMVLVYGQCQTNQQSLLLQMKNSLKFDPTFSVNLVQWNPSADCCTWSGVDCDVAGYVIGLDLNSESISGGIENSNPLFSLHNLQRLNLAFNSFNAIQIPSRLANLTNLQHLNLSDAGFVGQIPIEISHMTRLVTLDLSTSPSRRRTPLILQSPNLRLLVQNLTELRELYLDYVNISAHGNEWCQALSSSLPNLQVLSLSGCSLSGPIHSSLEKIQSLSVIRLDRNNISSPIPRFHMFKNLTHLDLFDNVINGTISSIDWQQLLNLVLVDLSSNSLNGNIPSSMFTLPLLQQLYLERNQFEGQLPEFPNPTSSKLQILDLSGNRLEGPIPKSIFELRKLDSLVLFSNKFNGTIKLDTIQRLVNLTYLSLSHNKLIVNASSSDSFHDSQFTQLGLASCRLGVIPNLRNQLELYYLDLSDNQISGKIPSWVWKVGNGSLVSLNLSRNLLVGLQEPYNFSFSEHALLDLHSNGLQGKVPQLPPSAFYVDYSRNNFNSSIPNDIGNHMANTRFFSLSSNSLKGVIPESLCNATSLEVVDFSDNNLSGKVPTCLIERGGSHLAVLNLRRNNLNGIISNTFPKDCGLQTLNLNGNEIEGMVPRSLANCTKLEVLDLGYNHIKDTFPCWLKYVSSLHVLVLHSNNFYGNTDCSEMNNSWSWPKLQIIDLASNNFTGTLPRKWLTTLKAMMFHENEPRSKLNHLHFGATSYSLVKYQNAITINMKGLEMELVKILTIFTSIDLSHNNFQGSIPEEIGQLELLYGLNLSHNSLTGPIPSSVGKLRQLEWLDLSMNNLGGEITVQLASLHFLSVLNLSYNHLVGRIPSSTQLQSFLPISFEGNEGLCGPPLMYNCTDSSMLEPSIPEALSNEIHGEYITGAVGFVVAFGAIVTPLMFSKKLNRWYDYGIHKFLMYVK